jgi:hypothetical protein
MSFGINPKEIYRSIVLHLMVVIEGLSTKCLGVVAYVAWNYSFKIFDVNRVRPDYLCCVEN